MHPKTRKILTLTTRWLLPLMLTCLLLWVLLRKVDFAEMHRIISGGCDYWWIFAAMLLSVLSHVIRAARWRIQLSSLDIRPPFMALCCSIFGCYALNLVFPRLGEVWRVTYISRLRKAPFTTIFGSLVADRLMDTLAVGALTLLTFIVANSAINSFLEKYQIGRDAIALISSPILWIAAIAVIAVAVLLIRSFRHHPVIAKLIEWSRQLWQGFAAVAVMPGRGRFLLLTLALWGCYFVQLYVAFFAFPFTRALCANPDYAFGITPCLLAFVLSSIGMAIPSNGGLGPWNIAIMFGLAVYGISDTEGTTFSILQWSGQTVMLIILGIYTMAYIATSRNKNKSDNDIPTSELR